MNTYESMSLSAALDLEVLPEDGMQTLSDEYLMLVLGGSSFGPGTAPIDPLTTFSEQASGPFWGTVLTEIAKEIIFYTVWNSDELEGPRLASTPRNGTEGNGGEENNAEANGDDGAGGSSGE